MEKNHLDLWIQAKHQIDTKAALQAFQLQRIQELFQCVKQKNPFYKNHYKGLNAPSSLEDFSKLPTIYADDIAQQGETLLCVSPSKINRIVSLETSATTGRRKRIFFTTEDQELTIDYFRHGMRYLCKPQENLLVLLPFKTEGSVGDLLIRGLRKDGVNATGYGLVHNLRDCYKSIQEQGIHSLVGVPCHILAIAHFVAKHQLSHQIKTVLLSTESAPQSLIDAIEHHLGCTVFNHYGMTEAGLGISIDCHTHDGLHIRENDLYYEVVNAQGCLVPDGTVGELIMTTLTRQGMPLLRYKTGDLGYIHKGDCPCGSMLKRLTVVGRPSFGSEPSIGNLDHIVFATRGVLDYQITRGKDSYEVTLLVLGADEAMCEDLMVRLHKNYPSERFTVRIVKTTDEIFPYGGKRTIKETT